MIINITDRFKYVVSYRPLINRKVATGNGILQFEGHDNDGNIITVLLEPRDVDNINRLLLDQFARERARSNP